MKLLKRPLITMLALTMPALNLHAQTPAGGDPFVKGAPASGAAAKKNEPDLRNCLFVMEVYSMEKNDAAAILDSERGSAARYRRITDLAAAGKARLEILTALTTKTGQRAVTESTDEVLYPSNFNPPQNKKDLPGATDWEMRKVGDVLEFEPVILSDGRTCEVNLAPTHARLVGFRDIDSMPGESVVFQPQFESQKLTSSVTVVEGEPHYAGSFSPPAPAGIANGGVASQVWMAFVHMTVQKPATEAAKPQAKPADWSEVHLEYTCYSVDRAAAREILLAPNSPTAHWEKLQALDGQKKARLEHVVSVNTRPGQRAGTDETQEFFYANAYSITQWTGTGQQTGTSQHNHRTVTTGPAADKQDTTLGKETGKGSTIAETVESNQSEPNPEKIPGTADSFATRYLGMSIQVEPVVSPDGLNVDLNQYVQSSAYLGDLKATGAGALYTPRPIFQTRQITTAQVIPAGRPVLVGTMNPPMNDGVSERTDSGRTWLVFVRATSNEP